LKRTSINSDFLKTHKEKEMVEFRKWFPALAIVALLLGSAVMASAQQPPAFTCSSVAGVPPVVRSEGIAELVGDIVLNCTGGVPTAADTLIPGVNVSVFLNTNITSKIVSTSGGINLSEALLLIDEPNANQQRPCTGTSSGGIVTPICLIGGVGGNGVDYRNTNVANVFQAQYVPANSQSGNQPQLFWPGVPVDPPGTVGTRVMRITNLRANASGVGVGTTFIPGSIQAFVSITSTQPVALTLPAQGIQVAFTLRGLASFTTVAGVGTASPFLQCTGNNVVGTGNNFTITPGGMSFRARFTEGFASSFKPRGNPAGSSIAFPGGNGLQLAPALAGGYTASTLYTPGAQNTPGQNTFTETGFYNPNFTTTNGLNVAGLATQGTRLVVKLSNIPLLGGTGTGSVLYAGIFEAAYNGTAFTGSVATGGASRVVLISGADANGAGGTAATGSTVGNVANLSQVAVGTGGTATLVYEVVTADPNVIESVDIPFFVAFPSQGAPLTTPTAPAMTGELGPFYTPTPTVINASSTLPVPRFVDSPLPPQAPFVINPCRTNLLFPYVTNQAGFDTGMAIANTSLSDPAFATVGQTGACTLNFFANQPGGTPAPTKQTTARQLAPGETVTYTLNFGSPSAYGLTPVAGFQGYIIAQCDFQYAHGFAFITDGPIGTARVAEGYLALVMDSPVGSRTGYTSEVLAH